MVSTDMISFSTKGFSDILDITDKVAGIVAESKTRYHLPTFCHGSDVENVLQSIPLRLTNAKYAGRL